jgi:hypothetical protein
MNKFLVGAAWVLLTVLVLVSLALNGVVIYSLVQVRDITLGTVGDARQVIAGVDDDVITHVIEVEQEIPVSVTVPIDQDVLVPIQTTIPISTVVTVPVKPPLLPEFSLPIPIQAVIPVDLEVVVPISETVPIDTVIPLDVEVPVEIPLADTPVVGYLDQLDEALSRLEERLADPLGREAE